MQTPRPHDLSLRQAINFEAIRKANLNPYERAVILHVLSFSKYCLYKRLSIMAKELHMCERTLRYSINGLVEKGMLQKTYTYYKRVVLKLNTLQQQAAAVGTNFIKTAANKLKKQQWLTSLRHDRHEKHSPDRHDSTESTKNKDLKNKKDAFNLNEESEKTVNLDVGNKYLSLLNQTLRFNTDLLPN